VEPAAASKLRAKVEVLEFFWYGCPHCYNLQPTLHDWMKTMPKDVEYRRVPTIFRESWVRHARCLRA